jgi:hypothetical protein
VWPLVRIQPPAKACVAQVVERTAKRVSSLARRASDEPECRWLSSPLGRSGRDQRLVNGVEPPFPMTEFRSSTYPGEPEPAGYRCQRMPRRQSLAHPIRDRAGVLSSHIAVALMALDVRCFMEGGVGWLRI